MVYNKHSGTLVGFTDLRDVNDLLSNCDRSLSRGPSMEKNHGRCRGAKLTTKLQYLYAQFATTADQIISLFWECVMVLLFLQRLLIVPHQLQNRAFMNIHKPNSSDPFPYKVLNPLTVKERHIHFISDPPHLLKTVRNCWYINCSCLSMVKGNCRGTQADWGKEPSAKQEEGN